MTCPAVVRVTVPGGPAVARVATPGPPGPLRIGGVLIDAATAGTVYVGTAPLGTAESDAEWLITCSQFNTAGVRTSKGQAADVTWADRATHTYL